MSASALADRAVDGQGSSDSVLIMLVSVRGRISLGFFRGGGVDAGAGNAICVTWVYVLGFYFLLPERLRRRMKGEFTCKR